MARDPFEEELFDALENYDSPLDKEEAWQSLEEKLPNKEDKKRRIYPFWLNMFGLLVLAGITLYSVNLDSAQGGISGQDLAPEMIVEEMEGTERTERTQRTEESGVFGGLTEEEGTEGTQRTQRTERTEGQTEEQTNGLTDRVDETEEWMNRGTEERTKRTQRTDLITIAETTKDAVATKAETETDAIATRAEPTTTQGSPIALSTLAFLHTKAKALLIPNMDFKRDVHFVAPVPRNKLKTTTASLWSIGIHANYGLSSIDRTALSTDQAELTAWLNDTESALDYSGFEFTINRQLHTNLSVFSGLQFSMHRSTFNYSDAFEVMRETEDVVYEIAHYLNGDVIENTRTQEIMHNVRIDAELGQRHRQVSIPLGISLHSDRSKNYYLQADLGYQFSLYQSNAGRKLVLEEDDYQIISTQDFETANFQALHTNLLFGKNLSKKLALQFGLRQSWDLNSRLQEDIGRSLKFRGTGVQVGIVKGF